MSVLTRVSKKEPCPACGKESWCLIGETEALCMRVSSERPYTMKNGDIGYFHTINGAVRREIPRIKRKEAPALDCVALMNRWNNGEGCKFRNLAESLGVTIQSLVDMRVRYAPEYQAWAFPMREGSSGKIVGIRLRSESGKKWSVTGSRQGIFLPYREPLRRVWLCEGPTDTAALLSLGMYAIGRPSCSGGMNDVKQAVHRLGCHEAIILADNDDDKFTPKGLKFNPGIDGAKSLARNICIKCCIVTLQCKDVREFIKLGGSPEDLEMLVDNTIWENPTSDSESVH